MCEGDTDCDSTEQTIKAHSLLDCVQENKENIQRNTSFLFLGNNLTGMILKRHAWVSSK